MDQAGTFALTRSPFAAIHDPALRVHTRTFERALTEVLKLARRGQPLIAVMGAAGTGKTLLLRAVQAALGVDARWVDRGEQLGGALTQAPAILLADEGDRADGATLTRVARGEWPRPVIVACARDCLRQLAPSVRPRPVRLEPLSDVEARALLLALLARTGRQQVFTPDALDAVVADGRGTPRALLQIAGAAWTAARLDDADEVDETHVEGALAMRRPLHGAADHVASPQVGWATQLSTARGNSALSRVRLPAIGAVAVLSLAAVTAGALWPGAPPPPARPQRGARDAVAAPRSVPVAAMRVSPSIGQTAPADVSYGPSELASSTRSPPAATAVVRGAPLEDRIADAPALERAGPPPAGGQGLAVVRPERPALRDNAVTPTELAARLRLVAPPLAPLPPPVQLASAQSGEEPGEAEALIQVTAARSDVRAAREAAIQAREAMQAARMAGRGG